ncbi:MAG: hypothetical protein JNK76_20130 [Planctomycetales bacterium]|nr:hypothetical protein [Planctomycetales bacterium]MBN8623997.1 hypothetical protein [Planctomycetota bacterium]
MHRQFAGILGSIAFTIVVLRGWAVGGDAAAVIPRALGMLILFAIVGAAAGRIGLWMVEEGVAARFRDQLAQKKSAK